MRREQLRQVDGTDIRWAFERDLTLAENIADATERLLDAVQDIVSEALAEPWPTPGGASRETMATPDATVAGGELRAWYGDERAPALALDTIPIASLAHEP